MHAQAEPEIWPLPTPHTTATNTPEIWYHVGIASKSDLLCLCQPGSAAQELRISYRSGCTPVLKRLTLPTCSTDI